MPILLKLFQEIKQEGNYQNANQLILIVVRRHSKTLHSNENRGSAMTHILLIIHTNKSCETDSMSVGITYVGHGSVQSVETQPTRLCAIRNQATVTLGRLRGISWKEAGNILGLPLGADVWLCSCCENSIMQTLTTNTNLSLYQRLFRKTFLKW